MADDPGLLPGTSDFALVTTGPRGPTRPSYPVIDQQTVCVVDNGLFPELAVKLAKDFGKTYYMSSWLTAFPRSNELLIGAGIPGVTRIDSIWPIINEVDLFVFPDIFHGPLQVFLRRIGKRVWGSALGENLEIMRGLSKRWLRDLGLPVGPYRQIRGLANLRAYLKENENQYVKISRTRGDMETFHAKNYKLIEPRLDELEHSFGARKAVAEFIVEEPIDPAIEVGYDGFTIDGQFPKAALFGVEIKDTAYLGNVVDYQSLPAGVRTVNQGLSKFFLDMNYRGFYSSEIRVKNGTPYLIDPCCRMASPPGELYTYMIDNLADILWRGSIGEVIEPEYNGTWGAQLVMRSPWAEQNWQPVEFPASMRDNVKLHYLTMIDGRHYYVPQQIEMPEIGSVVASGTSADDAMNKCVKLAEKVQGYGIKFQFDTLEQAAADMRKLKRAA
jgi:hypothetical protein